MLIVTKIKNESLSLIFRLFLESYIEVFLISLHNLIRFHHLLMFGIELTYKLFAGSELTFQIDDDF